MIISAQIFEFESINYTDPKYFYDLQDILKSYTVCSDFCINNFIIIENEKYYVWATLFKSENEFEQILIHQNDNTDRSLQIVPFKYILKGILKEPRLKTIEIVSSFENKVIAKDFKIFSIPSSNWDFINVNGEIYRCEDVSYYNDGKVIIQVSYCSNLDNFYSSF